MDEKIEKPGDTQTPESSGPQATDVTDLIYTDDLTGLRNRRYMREFLARDIPWNDPAPDPVSLVMMDLDHFKNINDSYGHLVGDRVLFHVARLLRLSFRRSDRVIRYAGDEFIVVLEGASKEAARNLAQRTLERFTDNSYVHDDGTTETSLSMSIGVATFPEDGRDPEQLIERADSAMYASKRAGRGRVTVAVDEEPRTLSQAEILQNFPCPALVARETALQKLAEYVPGSEPQPASIVVVEGESGMGKTRLLLELTRLTHLKNVTWLVERCSEEHIETPYYVLTSLIDQYVAQQPGRIASGLAKMEWREAASLAEQMPELARYLKVPRPLAHVTPKQRRELFFKALANLFYELSVQEPLALLIDEFQHVDMGTLAILRDLHARIDVRIGVFVALKASSLDDSCLDQTPLAVFHQRTLDDDEEMFIEMPLAPLAATDISEMISTILPGREPNAQFDHLLDRLSHGNPLYLEQTLKDMVCRGLIRYEEGRWHIDLPADEDRPATLDDAIRFHLGKLDPETADMLMRAAVIGPNFRLDILQSVTGRNQGYALDLLDKARRASVVTQVAGREDDELSFVSSHVRDVAYHELDSDQRKVVHEKLAEEQQERHKDDPDRAAAVLAFHFARAGNVEKAREFEERARSRARKLFNISEAVALTRKKIAPKIKEGDKALSALALARLSSALKRFCDAVEFRSKYPEAHERMSRMTHSIHARLQDVFYEAGTVTVKVAGNGFLVNGAPQDAAALGKPAQKFFQTLLRHNGEALTLTPAIQEREIAVFVDALAGKGGTFVGLLWGIWLGENNVRNLYVDQRVAKQRLVQVGNGEADRIFGARGKGKALTPEAHEHLLLAGGDFPVPTELQHGPQSEAFIGGEDKPGSKETPSGDSAAAAQESLVAPPLEHILSRDATAALIESIKRHALANDAESLVREIGSLGQRLSARRTDIKFQAADILASVVDIAPRLGSPLLLSLASAVIQDRLNEEQERAFLARLVDLTAAAISVSVKLGNCDLARALTWGLRNRGSAKRGIPIHSQVVFEKLAGGEVLDTLLADLHSDELARHNAAASVIAALGDYAIPKLLSVIRKSESYRVRRAVAEILGQVESFNARLALQSLTYDSTDEEFERLMSVFELLAAHLQRDISLAVFHADPKVRLYAVRVLGRIREDWSIRMLLEMAVPGNRAIAVEALKVIGETKDAHVGEELVRILPQLDDEALERECYIALGKLNCAPALAALSKAARAKGFLGIFGGKSESLRSAATWAIGQIQDERADAVLQKLSRDRSPLVAQEAKKALALRTAPNA